MQILAQLPNLQNLTLKGCPLAEQQGYPDNVKEQLSQLRILDSNRLSMSGKTNKQPGKAGYSAADVSSSGKGSSHPSANGYTAVDLGGSTVTKEGAQPKLAHRSEHPDTSEKQLAGPEVREQAPKRKRNESTRAAPDKAAGRPHHTSEEPAKKLKMIGSAAGPAVNAMPSAQAESKAGSTKLTSQAKAKSKQAAEANLQARSAYVQMPRAKLGTVEDRWILESTPGITVPQSSGAEPSGRGTTDNKTRPVAKLNSSKQRKAASIAPKQKSAKQPASKAKQPANSSHALASGKEVMHAANCGVHALV